MRKIFIEKNMQEEIMNRLIELRATINLYRYGNVRKVMMNNYRTALQAYEVSNKDVSEWKTKKPRLHRRKNGI